MKKIIVDLQLKDTEIGWIKRVDRLVVAFAPEWFKWLGWIMVLSAFEYLRIRTKSIAITFILSFSLYLFWRYLIARFDSLEIVGLPFIKNRKFEIIISTLIMCGMATGFWWIARLIMKLSISKP
jgi:hypothetical protein